MTPEEHLASARLKIERAKKHIRDVEGEIGSFLRTKPYGIKTKEYVQAGKVIKREYAFSRSAPIPPVISVLTGDAIHNLRSALDHVAHRLFLVGNPGRSGRHIYFPIHESVQKYRARKGGQIKGMRKDAIQAIDALKPYKGGNDRLWQLHELDNTDKHRLVLTVYAVFNKIDPGSVNRAEVALDLQPIQFKEGQIFLVGIPRGAEPNRKLEFTVQISISEPRIVDGVPILEMLVEMTKIVGDIVSGFAPCLT